MNEGSADFRRFHKSFFGSRGYGWEPDTYALLRLQGEERDTAEKLLLEKLQKGDNEAAYALGELGSTAAVSILKESLVASSARVRMASALALWKIERYPEAASVIVNCLRQTRPSNPIDDEEIDGDFLESEHVDAVCALGQIATPESTAALVKALDHSRSGVRYNAARALSWLCGHSREIALLLKPIMSKDLATRQTARDQILSLIDSTSVRDTGSRDYKISFDFSAQEYIVYTEGSRQFFFHPNYYTDPVTIPTGDYLDGILGDAKEFLPGERERVIPRLEEFLLHESAFFRLVAVKHPVEPEELTPAIGGKIKFQTLSSLMRADQAKNKKVQFQMETRVRYDWGLVSIRLAFSAVIFGALGFLGWGIFSLWFVSSSGIYQGVFLIVGSAVVGVLLTLSKILR